MLYLRDRRHNIHQGVTMKKRYWGIMVLLLLAALLAGCGGVQLQVAPKEKLSGSIKTIAIMEFADTIIQSLVSSN